MGEQAIFHKILMKAITCLKLIYVFLFATSGTGMADTEDGQVEPRRGKMTTLDSNIKFKDPLLNTTDRDSDDGEVGNRTKCFAT